MATASKPRPKMKWKSAPPELVGLFEDVMHGFPGAQVRKMFGYPAAFVNGNMLGGLFQDSMMLRLSASDLVTIRDQAGAKRFEPTPGRVMREYVIVPHGILKSKKQLKRWVGRACAYTSSLPAKPNTSSRKKA